MALTDGLIHAWNMNDNWDDSVGIRHMSATGATFDSVNKKHGSAAGDFDSNDYADVADNADLEPDHMTIAAWIRPGSVVVGERDIISKWWDGSSRSWVLYTNTDSARFTVSLDGATSKTVIAATTLAVDTWAFIVGTFDGSNVRLFVDNVYKGLTAASGTINKNTAPARMGADSRTPAVSFFDGQIDTVPMWDRAVSYGGVSIGQQATGEVAELWNGGDGLELPVVAVAPSPSMLSLLGVG
jgi:hypothetical protein